jgi:vancomycin permeability regulator SanA
MLAGVQPSSTRTPVRPWWRRGRIGWYALSLTVLVGFGVGITVAGSVLWVRAGARGHIYTEQTVPPAPVGLVLGAQVEPDGSPSPFLAARLALAQRLLAAGKVRVLLVSGDHLNWSYDEPGAMRSWLISHGVPAGRIVRDYAGLDTYDSCARAIRIFGVHRAIVVTQTYHLPRAVVLCRHLGIDADGVGDDSVRQFHGPWRQASLREDGACVKAVVDMLSGRDPVYLGRHETGVEDALRDS